MKCFITKRELCCIYIELRFLNTRFKLQNLSNRTIIIHQHRPGSFSIKSLELKTSTGMEASLQNGDQRPIQKQVTTSYCDWVVNIIKVQDITGISSFQITIVLETTHNLPTCLTLWKPPEFSSVYKVYCNHVI